MRRISLALALLGAVAAAGCGGGSPSNNQGGARGVAEGTFTVTIQNGQDGNAALAISGGYVTSTPAGIDCGIAPHTACSASFPSDTTVVLTATPVGTGMMFLGWAGDCSGEAACTLAGKADRYLVASFGTERRSHANFSDPAVHAPAYVAFSSGDPGALQCTTCHGPSLQGMGIALSCGGCHPNPRAPVASVPAPAGGISGVVTSKAGPVANARVYLVPTMDVSADSIFLPKAYSPAASYAAGALVSAHEGVWKAKQAVTGVEPPHLDQWADATNPNWEFVAVVHTPHSFSSRNSYLTNDLAIFANTVAGAGGEAIGTVFSVYESLVDQRGSTDNTNAPWSSITTTTISPPTTATGNNAQWEYIGPASAMAFFDNIPAFSAAKAYPRGALIRNSNNMYQAIAAVPAGAFNAASWNNLGSLVSLARATDVDEPLEGTIRAKAYPAATETTPGYVTTDASGVYTFTAAQLPDAGFSGKYYVTVIPTDSGHLPGGDICRTPLSRSAIVNTQVNIKVATAPSATASFVGPSRCLTCHTKHNTNKTAHALGIRVVTGERPAKALDYTRFPEWKKPFQQFWDGKTAAAPTVLYVGASGGGIGGHVAVDTDTLTPAGIAIDFVASLFVQDGRYYVKLEKTLGGTPWPGDGVSDLNGDGIADAGVYNVELSYGGAVYKQRFITKIGALRQLLPLQFNDQAIDTHNTGAPKGRGVWADYNSSKWGAQTSPTHPGATSSFDTSCAGCHFTGYKGDPATNTAIGVSDPNGEYDYDGDGQYDMMNLSCETCHGPGSDHAASDGSAAGIVNPALLTPEREVNICAQCHTRVRGNRGNDTPDRLVDGFNVLPRPGTSRKEFLTEYVTRVDEGMWDSRTGNGKYSKSHHQQASDFLTTEKYRNHGIPRGGWSVRGGREGLGTCSSCHDLHGDSAVPHQLNSALEEKVGTTTTAGLCTTCHDKSLGGTGHTARGSVAGATSHTNVTTWTCASCHVPKTAKSGAGSVAGTVAGDTFYNNDISSHLFIGVPYVFYSAPSKLSSDAKTVAADADGYVDIMPIPYTSACGACHTQARTNWKNGTF